MVAFQRHDQRLSKYFADGRGCRVPAGAAANCAGVDALTSVTQSIATAMSWPRA
jgi:hypothetical protein